MSSHPDHGVISSFAACTGEPAPPSVREPHLDAICRTLTVLFDVPFSSVSVLDAAHQRFAAWEGFAPGNVPRETAFCSWTVAGALGEPFVVRDTHQDARFADHPLVTNAPHLRFYAGIPLSIDDGQYSATLCVADARPRPDFGEAQVRQLRDVAHFVEAFMQLRLAHDQRARTLQDFQSTLDGMDQGVLTTDADDRVRVSNRRAAELMGVPERMCQVGALFAAIREHQTARGEFAHLPDHLRAWLERGEPEMRQPSYERERADGTALHVSTLPVAGGGLVRVFTDVSDRRCAERALRASETRYRTLVEVLPQMVVIACTETGEARYANQRFAEYHGPIDPTLQARIALVHPDDLDHARQAWLPVHQGAGGSTFEARLRRHDGVYRWHKLAAVPIPQDDAAVLCTALDIDEIVVGRRKLEQATDLLRLAQEAAGPASTSGTCAPIVSVSPPPERACTV